MISQSSIEEMEALARARRLESRPLPCPFCGHGAAVTDGTNGYSKFIAAHCTNCPARIEVHLNPYGSEQTEAGQFRVAELEAIMAWNRRVPGGVR